MGHAALNGHVQMRNVRESDGIIGFGEDCLAEVLSDLVPVDVERGGEFDVADVIAAQFGMHQPGNEAVFRCIIVIPDTLNERRCAVADADDGNPDFSGHWETPLKGNLLLFST